MAVAALLGLYCLSLTLSNGNIKRFTLDPKVDDDYSTPIDCDKESDFWVKPDTDPDVTVFHILGSPLDFIHRTKPYVTTTAHEWLVTHYNRVNVRTAINGNYTTGHRIGLNVGDTLLFKYSRMSEPLILVYTRCDGLNETVAKYQTNGTTTRRPPKDPRVDMEDLEEIVKTVAEDTEELKTQLHRAQEETNEMHLKMQSIKDQGQMGSNNTADILKYFVVMFFVVFGLLHAYTLYYAKRQDVLTKGFSSNLTKVEIEVENLKKISGDTETEFIAYGNRTRNI